MKMDKETYATAHARQNRTGTTNLSCSICGENYPAVIEMHHTIGRGNSDEVIPLCKNCHAKITNEQNKLPRQKRKGLSFILVSIGALLKEMGIILINCGHEVSLHE